MSAQCFASLSQSQVIIVATAVIWFEQNSELDSPSAELFAQRTHPLKLPIYSVSQKKVAPLKLFAIFLLVVNLCN